jgi:hypothetical protein
MKHGNKGPDSARSGLDPQHWLSGQVTLGKNCVGQMSTSSKVMTCRLIYEVISLNYNMALWISKDVEFCIENIA